MKAVLSVLLSELSGKAGNVVASRWKGIPYFRELVTPANPNSVAQQTQRGYMTTVVSWLHDLESQVTDYLDDLASGYAQSGANMFVGRNVKDMADSAEPRIIPLNTAVNGISGAAATQSGAGQATITWDQDEATTDDKVYILRATYDDSEFGLNLTVAEKDNTTVQSETTDITGLAEGDYAFFVAVETAAGGEFSVADMCTVSIAP